VSLPGGAGQDLRAPGRQRRREDDGARLLATLLKPTSGTALVAGHDVVREPDRVRANVGFLAASTALYARLTAREMIAYFGG
jgi:ABC-type Na+ transport system ATPase subunit NatA